MKVILFKRRKLGTFTLNGTLEALYGQGKPVDIIRESVAYNRYGAVVSANAPVYEEVA